MIRRLILLAALVLTPSLGGCVSTYVQPVESPDVAHVTYNRMPGLSGFGHIQTLILADGPMCDTIQQLDSFSPISSNFGKITERQVLLPGGARTWLVALTTAAGGMGYGSSCKNMVSFTPARGGRYQVTHFFEAQSCRMEVIDSATGAAPADLQFHAALPACTENLE